MGVSVEDRHYAFRIDDLRKTRALTKFVSFEPLIGPPGQLDLSGIDWVIVGGETGPRARPMEPEWALDIRDQCCESQVPSFFKQWGGPGNRKRGRLLQGRVWDQMPSVVVQECAGSSSYAGLG